ncbi:dipeptide ABC transporter ATP-binding protein [Mesorhizobium sp. NBSH29]|uniref:ABC transporter ATP-binding protein n=1 Tax=Mesorhizobium sp. NBSH29 TaxID=2654249 RepID=UPI0018964389|nr:ABC transporter ATP-binding protein [Mesorhizobium sp. NBSH29]QPC88104.1 dipeptide ABC transporter ATP-binding protein [Mesorhizobium sp. NBSH29]
MTAKTSTEPVLTVSDLTVSIRGEATDSAVVSDFSFSLHRGETLCIAGESGSGKSVTSLAIMGLLPQPAARITSGSIRLGDRDLTHLPERQMREIRGNQIAMIFQEPMTSLNPVLTIGRQLVEAIETHAALSGTAARAVAVEALKAVRIPDPEARMKRYPHELSGGMRQRVMIAMALALKPDVLIADEPTTALDVTVQGEVLELLRDLQATHGTAVILITHDMGVVAEMADRVIIMRHGRNIEEGTTRDIFERPQAEYTRELLAAVPKMGAGRLGAQTSPVLPRTAEVSQALHPVVRIRDLHVHFDLRGGFFGRVDRRVHAVEGIGFDIAAHETVSLVGESGCGKSTTAKAIAGLVPFAGEISINGRNVVGLDRAGHLAIKRDVQMIFQDPYASLDPRMRVGELVEEPLLVHGIGSAAKRREQAAYLFERVGLSADQMERYPHEFSGGQRQRICIARALTLKPKLIIADESVSALDVSVQARVLTLLKELQKEFGLSYLFISHDMAVVENISDRVAVMYLGQIVEMGTRDQVFSNPQHAYTRRLIDAVPNPDPRNRRTGFTRLDAEIPSPVHALGNPPEKRVLNDVGEGHLVAAG